MYLIRFNNDYPLDEFIHNLDNYDEGDSFNSVEEIVCTLEMGPHVWYNLNEAQEFLSGLDDKRFEIVELTLSAI